MLRNTLQTRNTTGSFPVNRLTAMATEDSKSVADLVEEEELLKRELVVFNKDLGNVPCFRNSFLYGITGGFGSGLVHFAVSSRVQSATKFGFYSYVGITLAYWIHCRYHFSATRFRYTQLQYALKHNALAEGTVSEMEKDTVEEQ